MDGLQLQLVDCMKAFLNRNRRRLTRLRNEWKQEDLHNLFDDNGRDEERPELSYQIEKSWRKKKIEPEWMKSWRENNILQETVKVGFKLHFIQSSSELPAMDVAFLYADYFNIQTHNWHKLETRIREQIKEKFKDEIAKGHVKVRETCCRFYPPRAPRLNFELDIN